MKCDVEISPADVIRFGLLLAEGIFVRRIIYHHNMYPDSLNGLALTVMPFLALIEHNYIPYLDKKFGFDLPKENADLTRIRHRTESIDSRCLNYRNYSGEAARIIKESRKHFRGKGVARSALLSLIKDIGISPSDAVSIEARRMTYNHLDMQMLNALNISQLG